MPLSPSDYSYLVSTGENWGSCYTYNYKTKNDTISVDCSIKAADMCDGIYHKGVGCTGYMYPDLQNHNTKFWTSNSISGSSLANISVGSIFAGGIYGGTCSPAGISFTDKINSIESTDTETHALIIYPDLFIGPCLKKENSLKSNTSYYNGKYNLILEEGNSKQPSPNFDSAIFRDWCWPSIGELFFIKKQYGKYSKFRNQLDKLLKNSNSKILTSSSVFSISATSGYQTSSKLNNNNYLYGLDPIYGAIILTSPHINASRICIRTIKVDPP